jgi:RNA polymerase sigma-70 factor, ECF subfamily
MAIHGESDEVLLASSDAASFEAFYVRHVDELLGFFARRTRDAEAAADLTAETFAAALTARRRYRPEKGSAGAWLYGIALKKLADMQRRGFVERRARRRLGMERLDLTDGDLARIDALAGEHTATLLVQRLAPDQRQAVVARVVDERAYEDIAGELGTSEAVVRKRVSRGLDTMRRRMVRQRLGGRR